VQNRLRGATARHDVKRDFAHAVKSLKSTTPRVRKIALITVPGSTASQGDFAHPTMALAGRVNNTKADSASRMA
jgi:hypothetical protein